jgi:SPP1 family predicted phage head-tail adaptor
MLRRRVTIQKATEARSETGQGIKTWGTWKTVWAEIVHLKGREFIAARQELGESTLRFKIAWVRGVKQGMRIQYNGSNYDIIQIIPTGGNTGMTIMASTSD